MPGESDIPVPDEEDLPYEEDVLRNPYFLKSWIRYLDFKREAVPKVRNMIYERALRELPGSYKLWHAYLVERVIAVRGRLVTDPALETVNNVFERALVFMHKMPRIWADYCQFLVDQELVTRTRRTFDRALRSLPITQHDKIWKIYLKFIKKIDVPQTACRVYRRYLKLEPDGVEDYIDYLVEVGYYDEAALLLAKAVNKDSFESRQGKSKHQLWLQLCDLLSQHPKEINSLRVDAIIRGGLRKFTDEVGKLWTSLAEYYIQLAQFEKARDVFEEAVNSVITVRDFSHIWEAYTTFEDSLVAAKMDMLNDQEVLEDETLDMDVEEETADFELLVARYEYLIERQPLLLSSVLLRQNPHNVYEWHKRVKLFKTAKKIVETYTTALSTVDPMRAKGKPHTLWTAFAKFYEDKGRIEETRKIYERAVQVPFRTIDELAAVWCEYAEMELRHHNFDEAHKLLLRATVSPRRGPMVNISEGEPVQKRLYKNVKLWSFLADIEETLGTFQTTKAVYEKVLELRVATPQLILNYAAFLEEHKHFEDAFKAYEKGCALFNFPYVHDIWISYLNKFVKRYGGVKLERARDLFEQVLEKVPAKDAKVFFVMYAKLEEEFGLARHAMGVYDRACKTVSEEDRYNMYLLYIHRATEFFGITHTREIFMRATENLPEKYVKGICFKFADMERKLGEIDRARAIYTHCAQYCDPRTDPDFWQVWYDFEKPVGGHGNEDTFREMLRIKRSIQAQYNTQINMEQMLAEAKKAEEAAQSRSQADIMADLERKAHEQITPAAIPKLSANEPRTIEEKEQAFVDEIQATNPEEIVIREPGEEEETFEETNTIEEVAVPAAVFGAAAEKAAELKKHDKEYKGEPEAKEEDEPTPKSFKRKRPANRG